ncbi:MAG: Uma2 family endonuclease [Desulfitobacterium hafniense]|nr:Uma2 family endonuclease [Desulfitobacterium hafniense]
MADNKDLITAQNLADSLNLSVETIWRYTREKKIPYVELGNKQYRYRLLDVINSLSSSTVQENPAQYGTDTDKKLTYQDYLELPEEPGYSFELLEGVLIKEPSPNVIHQRVSRRLQRILEDYFWQVDPKGEVFDAPLDVTFHDITVVQPDLLYIAGEQSSIIKDTRIDGPPKLVVEVLSPSTSRKDRMKKLGIYQRAFVEHYWLVNPNDKTLECFALRDGTYSLVACGMEEAIVEHPDFSGLALKLQELWK